MKRILASGSLVLMLALYLSAQSPKTKVARAKAKAMAPASYGNSDAISELELKIYDYFLASDQLEGRNLPSRGFDTAALYVASHLAEWGLKPMGSAEKTNGPLQPYFMPFELATRSVVADESKISLTAPGGGRGGRGGGTYGGDAAAAPPVENAEAASPGGGRGGRGGRGRGGAERTTEFEYGKDWTMAGGGRGGAPAASFEVSGNLAFVGNGYIINKTKTDPFEGIDVKGKIVVIAGLPPELAAQQEAAGGGRGGGGGAPNPLGEPCTDFLNPEQAAAKYGAVAVITIPNFQQLAGGGNGGGRGGGANGPAYVVPKLQAPPLCPVVPGIQAGLSLANAIFQGQKKTASQIFYGAGSGTKEDSFALNDTTKISLKLTVKSEPGHAENVVAMLEGSDPVKKNEFVVISAHLDHIGLTNAAPGADNINNGADDDGSGSTALLGIAHAYAEGAAKGIRPERSIIFLWNAGEEKGLWGSQYFNEYPPIDITKVVAGLNIDMIGRTAEPGYKDPDATHVLVKPGEIMVVGPNISSDEMEKTLETVNDNYQKLTFNHFYDVTKPDATHDNLGPQPRGQRIFYRSDHYNFAKMGIPIAFFTDGLHVDYHRVTDSPDKIDYVQMVKVSRTISAIGWVIANQSGRPKLNATLPEQLTKDMKLVQTQGWGKLTPVLPPLPGEPF